MENSDRKLEILIITQGISRIIEPLIKSDYTVLGIVEARPRQIKQYSFIMKILFKIKRIVAGCKTLKGFCKKNNIPYYFMNKNDAKLEEWIKTLKPDVIVVYSMSQLLKKNIFSIPRYGTINLHPALLPKYRGPMPDFWMYYHMDLHPGVTVHYIDSGEDTGDIICQESYTIPLGIKSPDMNKIAIDCIGVRLIFKALDLIKKDAVRRIKQPEKSPTPRARLIRDDEHKNIIKWNEWPIEHIWHVLRGTELWLNAIEPPKGYYKGQRWSIFEYEKENLKGYQIGKIYKETRYFIACCDGKIYIKPLFSLKKLILWMFR